MLSRLLLLTFVLAVDAGLLGLPIDLFPNRDILLTNDDGWATAQLHAINNDLKAAKFNVLISAPAENESGSGSKTATPTVLAEPCEFNTCPVGSPAVGFNASDPRFNYVNSFPVDAVRFGLQTLAPKFFRGQRPELVVSGPNIGTNLGTGILTSGTVGAACEATKEGIPAVAFSGASTQQVSFTTLESDPTGPGTQAALINAALARTVTEQLLASPLRPILPRNITMNVNSSPTTNCTRTEDFKFIFTRNVANPNVTDVRLCGSDHLPDESTIIRGQGCHVTISVIDAVMKADVDAKTQAKVLDRVFPLLSCLPKA